MTRKGGFGDDILTGGLGDDIIKDGGGTDRMFESGNVNFTLTNTKLTGLGTDTLISIEAATLIGGDSVNTINALAFSKLVILDGAGNDKLTGGSGNDIHIGGAGSDTVQVNAAGIFTLTDASVKSSQGTDTLTTMENALLIGDTGNDVFVVSGWTKTASLDGGAGTDRVVDLRWTNCWLAKSFT